MTSPTIITPFSAPPPPSHTGFNSSRRHPPPPPHPPFSIVPAATAKKCLYGFGLIESRGGGDFGTLPKFWKPAKLPPAVGLAYWKGWWEWMEGCGKGVWDWWGTGGGYRHQGSYKVIITHVSLSAWLSMSIARLQLKLVYAGIADEL